MLRIEQVVMCQAGKGRVLIPGHWNQAGDEIRKHIQTRMAGNEHTKVMLEWVRNRLVR